MDHNRVIDADGHIVEAFAEIKERLEPRWRRPHLFPGDEWDRQLHGRLQHRDVHLRHLAAMDEDGIDVMVLYPTNGLRMNSIHEPEFATALARAYNDWLHEFCQTDPARLKPVALLAPQDPRTAANELNRAVTELGAVGGFVPTPIRQCPDWGDPMFDPIYAEAQRLDVGLAFHTITSGDSLGSHRFRRFLSAHAFDHPVEQMTALISTIIGGVFERFPRLRTAYLESGVGWVPYMMDRLDEEVEKRAAEEAPYLTRLPSQYILDGRAYFGAECGEKTIPDVVRWGLEDTLLYASDFPHWDHDPHGVRLVRERKDLSDAVKRKLLHDNAVAFYGSRVDADPATPGLSAGVGAAR